MKKFLIILLLIPFFTQGQIPNSAWNVVEVDELIQVSFPASPGRQDTTGYLNLYVNLDSAVFIISRIGSPIARIPEVHDRFELDQYYDGMANGILETTGVELIDSYTKTLGPLTTQYLKYSYTYKPEAKPFGPNIKQDTVSLQVDFRETLLLLIDSSNYVLHYWYMGPDSPAKQQDGRAFLQSLALRQDLPASRQYVSDPQDISVEDQQTGQFMGEALLFAVIFALILIGYFVVKWVKRKP